MARFQSSQFGDIIASFYRNSPIINASKGCAGHCNASVGDNGKDPSTAWQNPSGEWQMVTGGAPIVFGSMDFKTWYYIGLGFTTKGTAFQYNAFFMVLLELCAAGFFLRGGGGCRRVSIFSRSFLPFLPSPLSFPLPPMCSSNDRVTLKIVC